MVRNDKKRDSTRLVIISCPISTFTTLASIEKCNKTFFFSFYLFYSVLTTLFDGWCVRYLRSFELVFTNTDSNLKKKIIYFLLFYRICNLSDQPIRKMSCRSQIECLLIHLKKMNLFIIIETIATTIKLLLLLLPPRITYKTNT